MAEPEKTPDPAPEKKSSNLPMVALSALNLVATAGLAAFVVLKTSAPPPAAPVVPGAPPAAGDPTTTMTMDAGVVDTASTSKHGPMVKLDDFVVQLRNPEFDRYARLSFEVELKRDGLKSRFEAAAPEIRDAFIAYLSDRTYEELRGSNGLKRVKTDLFQRLRGILSDDVVVALYVTNFVVQ